MAGPAKKAGIATSKSVGGGPKSVASKPGGPAYGGKAKAAPAPKAKAAPVTKAAPRQMAGGSSSSQSAMAAAQARQKALSSKISIPKGETITPIRSAGSSTSGRAAGGVIARAATMAPPPKPKTPMIAQSRPKGYAIPKQR